MPLYEITIKLIYFVKDHYHLTKINVLTYFQEYEKPLREAKPPIISRKAINTIFFKIRDILQCHNMFHIELAECINVWDEREEIGNVFTASVSQTFTLRAYFH